MQQVDFLGRSIRLTQQGLEYEAGKAYVQQLLKEYDLEAGREVTSPETAGESAQSHAHSLTTPLNDVDATRYRKCAALCNNLAQDRCDLSHASKEVARGMASPTAGDEMRLKRVIRYLRHRPCGVYHYHWQQPVELISAFVDSDWGGCLRTRKSTSGGAMLRGSHCLGQWSRTQLNVALSSGEAELNAALKGGAELLCMRTLLTELDLPCKVLLYGDSAACSGTVHREGSGRVKHLEIKQLWLQQRIKAGDIDYVKIPRHRNCADSLAKAWSTDGHRHFLMLGFRAAYVP